MICTNCGKGELQEITGTALLICPLCSSKLINPKEVSQPTSESQWPTEGEIEKAYLKNYQSVGSIYRAKPFDVWKAAIQWLRTQSPEPSKEGQPKKRNPYLHLLEQRGELNRQLKECLEELVNDFSVLMKTYMKLDPEKYDLITKAKSLLNPDKTRKL